MSDVRVDHGAIQRLSEGPESPVGRYVGRLAEEVAQRARDSAPSRSGRLRASIHTVSLPDGGWAVVASTPYAAVIEAGKPYLRPALEEAIR